MILNRRIHAFRNRVIRGPFGSLSEHTVTPQFHAGSYSANTMRWRSVACDNASDVRSVPLSVVPEVTGILPYHGILSAHDGKVGMIGDSRIHHPDC